MCDKQKIHDLERQLVVSRIQTEEYRKLFVEKSAEVGELRANSIAVKIDPTDLQSLSPTLEEILSLCLVAARMSPSYEQLKDNEKWKMTDKNWENVGYAIRWCTVDHG